MENNNHEKGMKVIYILIAVSLLGLILTISFSNKVL
jgi:hypothetical protein